MVEISIIKINDTTYQVTVVAQSTTTHKVTIGPDCQQKLSSGSMCSIDLIAFSCKFLLARESNTSILRSFDLSEIAHYFPEFERELAASALL